MKFWQINSTEESMVVIPNDYEKDREVILRTSMGEALKSNWTPVKFKIYRKGKHRDFPDLIPGILLLTDKSIQAIGKLIENYVEFLDTENDDPKIYICNVIKVIEFAGFTKMSFTSERIKDAPIFKAQVNKSSRIYVSDEFRELVLKSKLKGLEFTEIWNSEVNEDMLLQPQLK